jgi:hypothetical protein
MDRIRRAIGRSDRHEAEAKSGGHGDHWGCVLRATEQDELLGFISRVIQEAERPEMFEAAGAGMAVHARGERLSACVLVVENKLVSAYPEATDGHTWPVTVSEVVPWANGIEGQVVGECYGAKVAFFDTRFYANRRKYRPGETYEFKISAFAYNVGRAADTEYESEMGAKISLRGAHAFMPANLSNGTADIDDYWFHSPLEAEPGRAELAGKRLAVYPIIVAIPEHFEMHVDLYAAAHTRSLDLADVQPNDDIEGFLWLQGRLRIEN